MAGLDLSSLGNLNANLGALLPDPASVLQNIGVSLAAGVALAGVKAKLADGTIPDPFHLAGGQGAPAANANNPNQVVGPTATAAAINAMTPAAQAAFFAAGGHLVG